MTLNKVSACGKRGCGACGVPPLAGGRRLQGCKVSFSVCYTGFASFKLSHFRQIVTTRRPALAQVSEGAQALDKLEVAFDCRGGRFPLTGGVQRGTRQPRPRLPIPRAEAGALALHMRSVWVLTETVGSAALEAARSSTRGSGWAPSGPVSPPWECRAAQSRQARPGSRTEALLGEEFDHAPVRTASAKPRSAQPPAHSAVKGRALRKSWSVARASSYAEGCASVSAPPPAAPSQPDCVG